MFDETNIHNVLDKLHKIFEYDALQQQGIESGYIKRSTGKISAAALVTTLVECSFSKKPQSLNSVCDKICESQSSERASRQALSQRLNNDCTVRLMRRALSNCIQMELAKNHTPRKLGGILDLFNSVYLEDSTTGNLHESAKEAFPSTGGSASGASFKLHTVWNYTQSSLHRLNVSNGKVTDQSTCHDITRDLRSGDLILRDLGYFSLSAFRVIDQNGAYFLSRLKSKVKVYREDATPISDLYEEIEGMLSHNSLIDIPVYVGAKEKLPVRLIIEKVPEHVYRQRMAKARNIARKHGYQVTKEAAEHNKYNLFITNIPPELVQAEDIRPLYSLRWQIELVFKAWKSSLDISLIRGQSANRVLCFILARIIALLILSSLHSELDAYTSQRYGKELSLIQFASWLSNHVVMVTGSIEIFTALKILESSILARCKEKRKRKTSRSILSRSRPLDLFTYQIEGVRKIA